MTLELFLIKLLAFLRPVLFLDVKWNIFGLNLFEFAAIGLTGILFVALSIRAAVSKSVTITLVDLFVLAFSLWCLAIYAVYAGSADFKDVLKLILPPLTYSIGRNIITDVDSYHKVLWLLIVGFLIPILLSAFLIASGQSITNINYWTGEPRFSGVYSGAHTMSHNVAFLLMLVVIYIGIGNANRFQNFLPNSKKVLISILVAGSLYCLYAGRVRTTLLGLIVFFGIFLFLRNKKAFIISVSGMVIVGALLSNIIISRFFYDVSLVAEGTWDTSKLGSNRPNIWNDKIEEFLALSLDKKIAGVNRSTVSDSVGVDKNSHNDYLELFIRTGPIGLLIYLGLLWQLLKLIMRLPANERDVFLAMFVSVALMNMVSNSYVSRFGLGQMFYLAMVYVGLPRKGD